MKWNVQYFKIFCDIASYCILALMALSYIPLPSLGFARKHNNHNGLLISANISRISENGEQRMKGGYRIGLNISLCISPNWTIYQKHLFKKLNIFKSGLASKCVSINAFKLNRLHVDYLVKKENKVKSEIQKFDNLWSYFSQCWDDGNFSICKQKIDTKCNFLALQSLMI